MRLPIGTRRGLAPLVWIGLLALGVVGVMTVSSVLTLREFFGGGSRGSAGSDQTPPTPARAPSGGLPAAPTANEGAGDLAARAKALRELEARLVSELSAGDLPAAELTRSRLRDAEAARDRALAPR
jgi:hypothetical protein